MVKIPNRPGALERVPIISFEADAKAVDRGYNAFEYIKNDPDMANLRKDSDYKQCDSNFVPKTLEDLRLE